MDKTETFGQYTIEFDVTGETKKMLLGTSYDDPGYFRPLAYGHEYYGIKIVNLVAPDDELLGIDNEDSRHIGYRATQLVIHAASNSNIEQEDNKELLEHIDNFSRRPVELPLDEGRGLTHSVESMGSAGIEAHPELQELVEILDADAAANGSNHRFDLVLHSAGIMATNIDRLWQTMQAFEKKERISEIDMLERLYRL